MLYLFEDYVLDPERRELHRGDRLVPVEPQVFDLLKYLIRNSHRVVSKDDLLREIWGGRSVSESVLTNRIYGARRAIGDNGTDQRLIRTLTKNGIRFVGKVREDRPSAPLNQVSTANFPMASIQAGQGATGSAADDVFAVCKWKERHVGSAPAPAAPERLPIRARLPEMPALMIGREDDLTRLKTRLGIPASNPATTGHGCSGLARGWQDEPRERPGP